MLGLELSYIRIESVGRERGGQLLGLEEVPDGVPRGESYVFVGWIFEPLHIRFLASRYQPRLTELQ